MMFMILRLLGGWWIELLRSLRYWSNSRWSIRLYKVVQKSGENGNRTSDKA